HRGPAVARSRRGLGLAAGRRAPPAGAARAPGSTKGAGMSAAVLSSTTDLRSAVRQVVGSSRPVSWVNTAYPFAAAYLLAGGGVTPALVIGTLWFLIPYNLLMYGVNDVFDYESDLRNPRKGGLEGVVLSRRWHGLTLWAAALSNIPFVVALVLLGDVMSTLVLTLSVF